MTYYKKWAWIVSLGGLNSRDESRSRNLNLLRQTFKTCWDFLDCRDKLFFVSVKMFKMETFQSRLCLVEIFVEIVKTNQDCWRKSRLSRQIKIFQEILTLWRHFEYENDEKSQQIEKSSQEICKNPSISQLRSRPTVKKWQNFQVSMNFSFLIETYGSRHWCQDEIEKSQSRSRFLNSQGIILENV